MQIPSIFQEAVRDRKLMISVSGFRAILPDGLSPVAIVALAQGFADTTGRRIILGRDSRPTGPLLSRMFRDVLEYRGKTIIDVGVAPTPTVKAAVANLKADAGIIITASHNPEEWNGIKFLLRGGFFYDHTALDGLLRAIESPASVGGARPGRSMQPGSTTEQDAVTSHINAILKALPNTTTIRKKKYRVVVDAVAGAGREALPLLLKELGCSVIPLYCKPAEKFPRPPEPTPAALREFGRLVKQRKAAVGFALDPDADRLVCGSPGQGAIHEEYTLPLAFLGKRPTLRRPSRLVVNLSTSTLLDAVAAPHKVERSPVGEANVVGQMLKGHAAFGGEGNGGVIDPSVPSYGRDSLAGAAWILSAMAARNASSLDELLAEIPPLFMSKHKLERKGETAEALGRFEVLAASVPGRTLTRIDRRDGLHMLFSDGSWAHLRASNTEPILRLILQADSRANLNALMAAFQH